MSRHRYPVEQSRAFERTTREKMSAALESFVEGNKDQHLNNNEPGNDSSNAPMGKPGSQKNTKSNESKKTENIRAKQATLKVVLGDVLGYGPALSEHIILDAGLVPSAKVSKDFKLDTNTIQALAEAVMKFEDWLANVIYGEKVPEGYIVMQQKNSGKKSDAVSDKGTLEQVICLISHCFFFGYLALDLFIFLFLLFLQMYDEFRPLLLNQFKSRDSTQFETFDAALDEFYSKIESQRAEQQHKTKENSAMQKLEKIKVDQVNHIYSSSMEHKHDGSYPICLQDASSCCFVQSYTILK